MANFIEIGRIFLCTIREIGKKMHIGVGSVWAFLTKLKNQFF